MPNVIPIRCIYLAKFLLIRLCDPLGNDEYSGIIPVSVCSAFLSKKNCRPLMPIHVDIRHTFDYSQLQMLFHVIPFWMLFFFVNIWNLHIPCHVENRSCLVHSCRYIYLESLVSLNFVLIFLCEWLTSTTRKSRLPQMHLRNELISC